MTAPPKSLTTLTSLPPFVLSLPALSEAEGSKDEAILANPEPAEG